MINRIVIVLKCSVRQKEVEIYFFQIDVYTDLVMCFSYVFACKIHVASNLFVWFSKQSETGGQEDLAFGG